MPIRGVEAEWPQIRSAKGRWGFRIALLALSTLFVAGLAFRNRGISLPEFAASVAVGTGLAVIGFILAVIALTSLWRRGGRGTRIALAGAGLGALGAMPAAMAILLSVGFPPLNDITTTPDSPPPLAAVAAQRMASGAAVDYPGPEAAAVQAKFYPDIVPLTVPQPPETVFDTAKALADEYGWLVVRSDAPGKEPGLLVAVAHTLFLDLEDDVAIRVAPAREGARIDMRSASRLGDHDLGTNARRIASFLAALEDRLNNPLPAR